MFDCNSTPETDRFCSQSAPTVALEGHADEQIFKIGQRVFYIKSSVQNNPKPSNTRLKKESIG